MTFWGIVIITLKVFVTFAVLEVVALSIDMLIARSIKRK